MVDFSQHLRKPAGQAPVPRPLATGDYQGVIKSWELGDDNKNKTPYARFHLGLTDWPSTVPEEERFMKDKEGKPTDTRIDLSKRQLRRDFFLRDKDGTDAPLWRLDKLLRSCGINMPDDGSRTYEECLPELVGAQVTVQVQHYVNQTTGEIGNQVGDVWGQN